MLFASRIVNAVPGLSNNKPRAPRGTDEEGTGLWPNPHLCSRAARATKGAGNWGPWLCEVRFLRLENIQGGCQVCFALTGLSWKHAPDLKTSKGCLLNRHRSYLRCGGRFAAPSSPSNCLISNCKSDLCSLLIGCLPCARSAEWLRWNS